MEPTACLAKRIEREKDALVITWQDGRQGVFSHRWLRENDLESRYAATLSPGGERTGAAGDYRPAPSPRSVALEYDETLVVAWAGAWTVSRFALADLQRYQPEIESAELALAAD